MTIGMPGMRRISEASEENIHNVQRNLDVAAAEKYLATKRGTSGYSGRRLGRDLTAAYIAASKLASEVQNIQPIPTGECSDPTSTFPSQVRRSQFARSHSIEDVEDDSLDEDDTFSDGHGGDTILAPVPVLENHQALITQTPTNCTAPSVPVIYVPARFVNYTDCGTSKDIMPNDANTEVNKNNEDMEDQRHVETQRRNHRRPVSAPLPDEKSKKFDIPLLWISDPGTPEERKKLNIPKFKNLFPDYSAKNESRFSPLSPVRLSPSSSPRSSPRPASSPRDSPRPPSFLRPPSPPLEDIEREEFSHVTCL